jgi:polyisoprenoid-binding protein YceI
MRRLAFLAVSLLVATPLVAQMAAPGSKNPAAVTGGTYSVDPNHTLIGWRVNHLGFNDYFGIFGESSGTLVLDPKKPNAAKVDITIPVSKVTTASSGLTAHLTRAGKDGGKPDFFGANAADAHFVSTSVVTKGMTAKITGNLTLNGVTKPVVLSAEFSGAGKAPAMMGGKENVGFHAKAMIKRTEFGLGFFAPVVSDEVALDITVAFQK